MVGYSHVLCQSPHLEGVTLPPRLCIDNNPLRFLFVANLALVRGRGCKEKLKRQKSIMSQLTCVCEVKPLTGPGGVAVELQPQVIGRTIDDMTRDAFMCEVAKETR